MEVSSSFNLVTMPTDLKQKILSDLPAKSLKALPVVSKNWEAMLTNDFWKGLTPKGLCQEGEEKSFVLNSIVDEEELVERITNEYIGILGNNRLCNFSCSFPRKVTNENAKNMVSPKSVYSVPINPDVKIKFTKKEQGFLFSKEVDQTDKCVQFTFRKLFIPTDSFQITEKYNKKEKFNIEYFQQHPSFETPESMQAIKKMVPYNNDLVTNSFKVLARLVGLNPGQNINEFLAGDEGTMQFILDNRDQFEIEDTHLEFLCGVLKNQNQGEVELQDFFERFFPECAEYINFRRKMMSGDETLFLEIQNKLSLKLQAINVVQKIERLQAKAFDATLISEVQKFSIVALAAALIHKIFIM